MKVGVFHQNLIENPGGAAAVTAWIIESLKKNFEVTLITYGAPINIQKINKFYGTKLSNNEIKIIYLPLPSFLKNFSVHKFKSLKLAFAVNFLKKIQKRFDILITTMNEIDLPFPSIQYVHCPIRDSRAINSLYKSSERLMRNVNNILFKIISGFREYRFKSTNHLILVNSQWTADMFRTVYNINPLVVYPPIFIEEIQHIHWEKRERGFVLISRIVPEKKIEEAIYIIDGLRNFFPDIHLHIIGSGDTQYAKKIKAMSEERDYVYIHENISKTKLFHIILSHQYGIHTAMNEHFGMAPAEMLMGGAIVFVHNSGGQIEIVNKNEKLIFANRDDAIVKIADVIRDKDTQVDLLNFLHEQKQKFDVNIFVNKINQIIKDFLNLKTRRYYNE